MDFYNEIKMVERDHAVIGLMSPEKLAGIAQFAGLDASRRVIEFGCGYGETLRYWARTFGISGIGIDISEIAIDHAKKTVRGSPFENQIDYVCTNATTYPFAPHSFDLAACINASNMFGEADVMFSNAIRHMKAAIRDEGHLLIVEPYYNRPHVPEELIDYEGPLPTETDLIQTMQREEFELVYMIHSDRADWDRYIASNLYFNTRWLKANQGHPEWQQKRAFHRRFLEMYVKYRRQYQGCVALLMTRIPDVNIPDEEAIRRHDAR